MFTPSISRVATNEERAPARISPRTEFVDPVVQQLTIARRLDPRRLYEDPFDGIAPEGLDAIFSDAHVTDLIARIRRFDQTAEPSGEQSTA